MLQRLRDNGARVTTHRLDALCIEFALLLIDRLVGEANVTFLRRQDTLHVDLFEFDFDRRWIQLIECLDEQMGLFEGLRTRRVRKLDE